MFYKKIDFMNDKQMFNYLKGHFNCNNGIKVYGFGISVDPEVLDLADYFNIHFMFAEWEKEHPAYEVYFNTDSGGYLVLTEKSNHAIFPTEISESEDYDEYERFCVTFYNSVEENRDILAYYTRLVQDFDSLCDEVRKYCSELTKNRFEITEMLKVVENFNCQYFDDLDLLGFSELSCDDEGRVNISEIRTFRCLLDTFMRMADRTNYGYKLNTNGRVIYYTKA